MHGCLLAENTDYCMPINEILLLLLRNLKSHLIKYIQIVKNNIKGGFPGINPNAVDMQCQDEAMHLT